MVQKKLFLLVGVLALAGLLRLLKSLIGTSVEIDSEQSSFNNHLSASPKIVLEATSDKIGMEKYSFHLKCNCSR